jgi:hypothetical protein
MQQRRLRLGDILDDYCPRERRITNHAVVAMFEDEVKQTRCTTCDAEHEYRQARVPSARRKKRDEMPPSELAASETLDQESGVLSPLALDDETPPAAALDADPEPGFPAEGSTEDADLVEDEGPVHRPLIRATLPRPEGQTPERRQPEFTTRQPGGRFDQRAGQRPRGRGMRHAQKPGGQPGRGGPRQGSGSGSGAAQGPRHGNNRFGNGTGQRGGRPPVPGRGQRQGGGQGRKRGR